MHLSLPLLQGLLIAGAAATRQRIQRQGSEDGREGPVEPDTAADCTFFDTARSASDNCAHFASFWGISEQDFIQWNPSVKSDCSGIKVGNSYCIEVNYGIPPTPTTTAAPSSTAAPKPTQTQYGLIDSCTEFYEAKSGDICVSIASSFGTFTWPDFLLWNPAVGDDCSRLYAGWYYCVDAPERAPTPTSVMPVETCNPTAPTPTQPGPICGCTKWYQVEEGDTCSVIINKFDLGENFYKWNSNFGSQCEYLYLGYYVCIGVE
ncbi:hypothetical protein CHGG_05423 [Chaetomium globosum CBS 148.51]|uniref:LysM domain-containing protein n=1 Tax=Chaetomium globosum (strain ATCC 6205 / CBS 148.51 / DSM 1962 / NBRC 6347 / NRRL 1970) TaxID=306901 RepID=Q2H7E2_CHAGB|nr:uncharacterized protein CHGG_05423 [Chaetomium globosum CBS 148.51]EAQ88804.1 hypothetical protein CHGG_05423 [Chaetomium globosum CBS 148.51]